MLKTCTKALRIKQLLIALALVACISTAAASSAACLNDHIEASYFKLSIWPHMRRLMLGAANEAAAFALAESEAEVGVKLSISSWLSAYGRCA